MYSRKLSLFVVGAALLFVAAVSPQQAKAATWLSGDEGNFAGNDVTSLNTLSNGESVTVTAATPTVIAPLPGAFMLFGTVLAGGLSLSAWRKRRKRGPISLLD